METLDIQKFDPTVEELSKLAATARAVVVTDINDKAQLDAVSETRKQLKAARVRITKTGKELRDNAVKFQKAVIAKEKELVGIIEPEENRLIEIEEEVERKQHVERMKLLLPVRRKRIADIGYTAYVYSDDELNAMDVAEFELAFIGMQKVVNDEVAAKNAADRAELDKEKNRLEEEKRQQEREERARQEERERIEREAKAKEAADKAAKEKAEAEADFKAWYDAEVAKDPKAVYKTAHGTDGSVALWKHVATYKPF